jgi:hypothetical protein
MRHNSRRHELKKADRARLELHKPILSMFINCSYMSKSNSDRFGPNQPTVDKIVFTHSKSVKIGQNRQKSSFCAFLRFCKIGPSALSAVRTVLRCSGAVRLFCTIPNLNKPSRPGTDQFGTVQSSLSHHVSHDLKKMARPIPNNSIRCGAECAKLLHTKSGKICSI